MKSHDRLRIVFAQIRQNWRAFAHVMHVHENHCIKRAGVAGIRARAKYEIWLKARTVLKDNFTSSFTA
ncbi:hypothetical protein FQG48_20345 [Escherichia coli]|uniref:Uncharacterized protein n=1 Tax=Escherichia coli TaxID=562 RepID=A0A5N8H4D7_ECOLX|nr:hypothetical protein [Escherichia coli]EFN3809732.1 hypothetical protein [Escherichia coli]EFN4949661.1 hypothetical protein [Escherichia coli]EFN5640545.1 hypothetical protein [Escherichia coli]MPU47687.1 hypothetical protein [Escherichia coli]